MYCEIYENRLNSGTCLILTDTNVDYISDDKLCIRICDDIINVSLKNIRNFGSYLKKKKIIIIMINRKRQLIVNY